MKKLVLAAIMMLVPFSAFALDAMNDDAMDKLTGQAGVTITFENVTIRQQAADMAWTDVDGCDSEGLDNTNAGTVYIAQGGDTVTTITGSLEIDVATATADIAIAGAADPIEANTTFVKIGLPSISQTASNKTMTISLNSAVAAGTQILGSLYQQGGKSSIYPNSAIYIYAH
jgi:hypothetical protein